ncbi:MAG: hypothetical protein H6604_09600 [Flavobacteriales bacterium]|nr:hypothetical protein [Flavobacteriales bacterium]
MENQESLNSTITISETSIKYLLATAKWGRFLAVVGFISLGLNFISLGLNFLSGIYLTLMFNDSLNNMPFGFRYLGLLYIIIVIIFIFPTIYLYKFSEKMISSLMNSDQIKFESSVKSQYFLFKFIGIYTIIILVLYILLFVGRMFI